MEARTPLSHFPLSLPHLRAHRVNLCSGTHTQRSLFKSTGKKAGSRFGRILGPFPSSRRWSVPTTLLFET